MDAVWDKNILTNTGIYTSGRGQYNFEVQDKNIFIRLYSDSLLFNKHEIDDKDREELKKLIKWLNTKERIKWIDSNLFNMSALYMYIRVKAAQDEDFLTWWGEYNFDIVLFLKKDHKWNKKG